MVQDNDGRTALLGLSFAVMGALKLTGLEARLFRRWGLSRRQMQHVGAIEALGAALVSRPDTRPLGAAGLTAVSALMLAVELRHRETELVLPRLALLALAVATFVGSASGRKA